MARESSTCVCPHCGRVFKVLADEWGDHPCPKCGFKTEIVDSVHYNESDGFYFASQRGSTREDSCDLPRAP